MKILAVAVSAALAGLTSAQQEDKQQLAGGNAAQFNDMINSIDLASLDNKVINLPEAQVMSAEEKAKQKYARFHQKPFQNVKMETIGLILMVILIALSVAGGLSGGGSNIPLMLIFFNMGMDVAVPISGFCAVSSTVYRFVVNWNVTHPTVTERSIIQYDIVEITMSFVFLGSFAGIFIGKAIGKTAQTVVFAITVAWSIFTTAKKVCELRAKEAAAEKQKLLEEDGEKAQADSTVEEEEQTDTTTTDDCADDDDCFKDMDKAQKEYEDLLYQERHHCTGKRIVLILINFVALFATQVIVKAAWAAEWQKYTAFTIFTIICVVTTFVVAKRTETAIKLKKHFKYKGDPDDITFKNMKEVLGTAGVVCFAACLCGCTGIAGGMVLGPLFMSYGMKPSVMSATNQYITMIASLSVVIQFAML